MRSVLRPAWCRDFVKAVRRIAEVASLVVAHGSCGQPWWNVPGAVCVTTPWHARPGYGFNPTDFLRRRRSLHSLARCESERGRFSEVASRGVFPGGGYAPAYDTPRRLLFPNSLMSTGTETREGSARSGGFSREKRAT